MSRCVGDENRFVISFGSVVQVEYGRVATCGKDQLEASAECAHQGLRRMAGTQYAEADERYILPGLRLRSIEEQRPKRRDPRLSRDS